MARNLLILTAGMGAGHDAVAEELSRGLAAHGVQPYCRDLLAMLPGRLGEGLTTSYRRCLERFPVGYDLLYRALFRPGRGPRPGGSALARAAEPALRAAVDEVAADRVVSVFHLGAQITGDLRRRGRLRVPSAVYVLDFVPHRQWTHAGNDLYLLLTQDARESLPPGLRGRSRVSGAVVPARFRDVDHIDRSVWRARLAALSEGRPAVLLSAGAWGVGSGLAETCDLLRGHGYLPVVLCGSNDGLQRRLERRPGLLALPWEEDLPGLMRNCHALIDNAAGQTAVQALAAGLPVVGYRPIPGHGRDGVRRMAALGMTDHATGPDQLLRRLDGLRLRQVRGARLAAARQLFEGDPAAELGEWCEAPVQEGARTAI